MGAFRVWRTRLPNHARRPRDAGAQKPLHQPQSNETITYPLNVGAIRRDREWRNAMNTLTELSNPPSSDTAAADAAPFFIRGRVVEGADQLHRSRDLGVTFATPKPDLNALVHPRTELPPLLNVKTSEIIDFLVEAGQKLEDPSNPHVQGCIDRMAKVSLAP